MPGIQSHTGWHATHLETGIPAYKLCGTYLHTGILAYVLHGTHRPMTYILMYSTHANGKCSDIKSLAPILAETTLVANIVGLCNLCAPSLPNQLSVVSNMFQNQTSDQTSVPPVAWLTTYMVLQPLLLPFCAVAEVDRSVSHLRNPTEVVAVMWVGRKKGR